MGWFLYGATNIVATSIVLGALKRQGAISLHPEHIKNDTVRTALVSAVSFGEDLSLRAENLVKDLSSSSK